MTTHQDHHNPVPTWTGNGPQQNGYSQMLGQDTSSSYMALSDMRENFQEEEDDDNDETRG